MTDTHMVNVVGKKPNTVNKQEKTPKVKGL